MIYSFELPASSLSLRKEEIYEAMGYGTHEPDESVKILTRELLAGRCYCLRVLIHISRRNTAGFNQYTKNEFSNRKDNSEFDETG